MGRQRKGSRDFSARVQRTAASDDLVEVAEPRGISGRLIEPLQPAPRPVRTVTEAQPQIARSVVEEDVVDLRLLLEASGVEKIEHLHGQRFTAGRKLRLVADQRPIASID